MEKNRDNCILLLIDPIEDKSISKVLKENFGLDEAKQLYFELLSIAYKKINSAIGVNSAEMLHSLPCVHRLFLIFFP